MGIRAGSDIAFLGGLVNYILSNDRWFKEYVLNYTRGQLWRIGMLALGGGTLIPLGLMLVGSSAPLMLGAVLLMLLGSLVIRFLIIRIPHAPS